MIKSRPSEDIRLPKDFDINSCENSSLKSISRPEVKAEKSWAPTNADRGNAERADEAVPVDDVMVVIGEATARSTPAYAGDDGSKNENGKAVVELSAVGGGKTAEQTAASVDGGGNEIERLRRLWRQQQQPLLQPKNVISEAAASESTKRAGEAEEATPKQKDEPAGRERESSGNDAGWSVDDERRPDGKIVDSLPGRRQEQAEDEQDGEDDDVAAPIARGKDQQTKKQRPTVKFHLDDDGSGGGRWRSSSSETSDQFQRKSPNTPLIPYKSMAQDAGEVPNSFLRTDSIIIRVKAGQCFSEFANVVVDSPARCDPKLGTLAELRHHLRTGTPHQVKKFLRYNHWSSGHRIRAELWKELCHDTNADAQRAVYKDIAAKLADVQTNPAFMSAPGVVISDHQLKENGRASLLRLVTAVEYQRPDFTYVPALYPLAALFLHYMNEEDAFVCVMRLLTQSQKFLIQTDIATAASKRTMVVLVKKHANRAYLLFKKLSGIQEDKNLTTLFDEWKAWIFRDLPFSHLVRVVDCFLFEGQKVLFRVTLAVILLWYKERRKDLKQKSGWSVLQISNDIAEFCRSLKMQPPKLLKVAFGIRNLKMSTIQRLQEKHELNLRRSNSGLAEIASSQTFRQLSAAHNFIDVNFNSSILHNQYAMVLASWIPARFQLLKPVRLFFTEEDGVSFTRLWPKIEEFAPTIILIRTSNDEIFGAYCSTAWEMRKRHSTISYFGTGETFLFRFTPTSQKFSWVGSTKSNVNHNEELFQAADNTSLIVGGGGEEGLSIRQSLESGSTGRCNTFDNLPLSSQRDFQIRSLEVYSLTADD